LLYLNNKHFLDIMITIIKTLIESSINIKSHCLLNLYHVCFYMTHSKFAYNRKMNAFGVNFSHIDSIVQRYSVNLYLAVHLHCKITLPILTSKFFIKILSYEKREKNCILFQYESYLIYSLIYL
jgi:hypothetical protein